MRSCARKSSAARHGQTTSDSPNEPIPDRATLLPEIERRPSFGPELARTVDYSCFAGAGAFLSTPSDLVRFGMASALGRQAIASSHRQTLQTPQVLASGEETEFGLGWMSSRFRSRATPRGGEPCQPDLLGGSTSFLTFPDRGIVVAVTSNISSRARGRLRWGSRRLSRHRGKASKPPPAGQPACRSALVGSMRSARRIGAAPTRQLLTRLAPPRD